MVMDVQRANLFELLCHQETDLIIYWTFIHTKSLTRKLRIFNQQGPHVSTNIERNSKKEGKRQDKMVAIMMTPIAAAAVQKQMLLQGVVGRAVLGSLAVLASVRYGVGIYFYRETEKLERPSYEVLQTLSDGVEIRRYQPYLIAETAVTGSGVGLQKHTAEGFRACAEYIFRKNQSKTAQSVSGQPAMEKMAMTAPVRIQQPHQRRGNKNYDHNNSDITKVSFVMSKAYTLRTLPKPLDKKVHLRKVHSHTLAVRRFSGPPPTDERVQSERQRIENALRKANIPIPSTAASTWVYGYHDPFLTPAFLRRNEVAIVLEGRP
jgi:hypothetical protein